MADYQNLTPLGESRVFSATRTEIEIENTRRELGKSLIDLQPSAIIEL
jgi:hypothetical protein